MDIPIDLPVRIHDILYKQVKTTDIHEGDLVLDLHDGAYGYVDFVKNNRLAIRHGYVAELFVPIERVIKLIPMIDHYSTN